MARTSSSFRLAVLIVLFTILVTAFWIHKPGGYRIFTHLLPKRVTHISQNRHPKPGRLLIVTYYRSGSTFTGDILQQSPDVFYVFEPLVVLKRYLDAGKKTIQLQNRTRRWLKETPTEYFNNLRSWFSCSIEQIDLHSLSNGFRGLSRSTESFWNCINGGVSQIKRRYNFLACRQMLESKCKTSLSKHIKSIRVSMKTAVELMMEFDDLKILHLLRDPRGVYRSRVRYRQFSGNKEVSKAAVEYCNRVLLDISESERWHKIFPERIRRVFYEDIASHPIEMSKLLFQYAGLKFSALAKEYITNISFSSLPHPKQCGLCVIKNDSATAAFRWRKDIRFGHSRTIDEGCSKLYAKLGYIKFGNSRDLANITTPSREPIYTDMDIHL